MNAACCQRGFRRPDDAGAAGSSRFADSLSKRISLPEICNRSAIDPTKLKPGAKLPGARSIGQDGFGYITDTGQRKIPQTGRVIIQNDVEIGAGTTIDRGGISDTVIGEATKIDNLCQIGHNVVIGRHCVIVAQSGLSGSVTLEDFAMLGGAVGLAPHVTIGRGGRVAARSGVMNDVPPGETWGGYPARPRMQWMRREATLARLTASDRAAVRSTFSDDN